MMRSRSLSILFALLSSAALGCSAQATDEGATSGDSAVVRGQASGPEQDMVVRLEITRDDGAMELCTGTLLADNLVLTARHCIAKRDTTAPRPTCRATIGGQPAESGDQPDFVYTGDVAPSAVDVIVGAKLDPDPNAPPQVAGGTQTPAFGSSKVAARGAEIVHDDGAEMCGHDVTLIVLDRHIPDAKTAPVRKGSPRLGEKLTAVGWGRTEQGTFPKERQTRAGIAVIGLDEEIVQYTRKNGDLVKATTVAGEFAVGESTCHGDSGGPLFDGEGRVVGVTSRTPDNVSSRCVDTAVVYTHAAAHAASIDKALARASSRP